VWHDDIWMSLARNIQSMNVSTEKASPGRCTEIAFEGESPPYVRASGDAGVPSTVLPHSVADMP
jgi:hypothetical protein